MSDDGGPDLATGDVPFARTYDYYKHLTGITLVSIGGVFAFLDGGGTPLDPRRMMVVLAALGIAGVTSLLMAAYLAGLEVKPVAPSTVSRRVRVAGFVSTIFLAIGLGAFIQTFASAVLG